MFASKVFVRWAVVYCMVRNVLLVIGRGHGPPIISLTQKTSPKKYFPTKQNTTYLCLGCRNGAFYTTQFFRVLQRFSANWWSRQDPHKWCTLSVLAKSLYHDDLYCSSSPEWLIVKQSARYFVTSMSPDSSLTFYCRKNIYSVFSRSTSVFHCWRQQEFEVYYKNRIAFSFYH